jgi:hypothetical protein
MHEIVRGADWFRLSPKLQLLEIVSKVQRPDSALKKESRRSGRPIVEAMS